MTDLKNFIDGLIKINKKDELIIKKECFYQEIPVKEIIEKYQLDENKIYIFANYILKIKNNKLKKIGSLYDIGYIDELIFYNLKILDIQKIDYFCSLFLRYLCNDIDYKSLSDFIIILNKININFDFIWFVESNNERYTSKEYGEELFYNRLAEKVFRIADLEYKLTSEGKKFFDNIYLNPTAKEKEIYSKEIDIDKMSTFDSVLNHKQYYEQVMKKIGNDENRIKVARLHDKSFKYFFEEYDVLIKYAIAKYGNDCMIRFCGQETKNNIKYDGIIKSENIEERVEITSPFYGEEYKNDMKELNRVGIGHCKSSNWIGIEESIKNIVKSIINKKNSMSSYDNTINLVVMFDNFEYLFSKQIRDENYINSIFEDLKKSTYKFKSVSILVDRYIGSELQTEPRIIKIK